MPLTERSVTEQRHEAVMQVRHNTPVTRHDDEEEVDHEGACLPVEPTDRRQAFGHGV
jgi:hypothetical protein